MSWGGREHCVVCGFAATRRYQGQPVCPLCQTALARASRTVSIVVGPQYEKGMTDKELAGGRR